MSLTRLHSISLSIVLLDLFTLHLDIRQHLLIIVIILDSLGLVALRAGNWRLTTFLLRWTFLAALSLACILVGVFVGVLGLLTLLAALGAFLDAFSWIRYGEGRCWEYRSACSVMMCREDRIHTNGCATADFLTATVSAGIT